MLKAVANFENAAQKGSVLARHKLAALYFVGKGVARDEAKGFALLQQAAEGGNSSAENELAAIYLKGLFGHKEDPTKAREWFTKSAESGNSEGIKNLAVMLKDGIGMKAPAPAESLKWYYVLQKAGVKSQELDAIIETLKSGISAAQAQKADKDADQWIAERRKREAGQ